MKYCGRNTKLIKTFKGKKMSRQTMIEVDEAAKILGVHKLTLRKWIKTYEKIKDKNPDELTDKEKILHCPPYGRIGNKLVFSKEKIEKFMEDAI